ncbi:MAG: hypothetical protein HRU15_09325 [Planctomycetes bacterium]|nr:hypothetical protein [Planctomycetota bacterium]
MPANKRPVRRSSGGGRSKLPSGLVRDKLDNDLQWQNYTTDGRWICPYCLKDLRAPRTGKSGMVHHIESHLGGRCSGFHGGEGQAHSAEEINDQLLTLHIEDQARSNTAWQVFDHEGFWYSPSSMQKIPSVRIVNGRFDGFTVQQMVQHLKRCPYYAEGRIYPVENVQAARDQGIRVQSLASNLERVITQPVWQMYSAIGWLCPYCTSEVASVQQHDQPGDILVQMAGHLMLQCATYQQDPRAIKSEAIVRQTLQRMHPATTTQAAPPAAPIAAPAQNAPPLQAPVPAAAPIQAAPIAAPVTPIAAEAPAAQMPPIAAPVAQPPLGQVPTAAPVAMPVSKTPNTPSGIHIPLSDDDDGEYFQPAPEIPTAAPVAQAIAPPNNEIPTAIPVAAPAIAPPTPAPLAAPISPAPPSREVPLAQPLQRTPSGNIPVAQPLQRTPSGNIPVAQPLQRTPSGQIRDPSRDHSGDHSGSQAIPIFSNKEIQ